MLVRPALIALIAVLAFPTAALAQPAPDAPSVVAVVPPPPDFTGWDWAASILLGDVGVVAGGTLGVLAGVGLTSECDRSEQTEFGCAHTFEAALIGGYLLAAPAAAGAITLYNDTRGHRGSYWAALGGSYLGAALAAGLAAATASDDSNAEVTLIAALTLPALGGTLGYYLSRDTSGASEVRSGALFDLGVDGVVRVSVPAVGFAQSAEDTRVTIPLLGGAL